MLLWTRWNQFWKHQPKLFSRSPKNCYGKVCLKKSTQNAPLDTLKSVLNTSAQTFTHILKQFLKVRIFLKKSFKKLIWIRWNQFWKHQPKLFSRNTMKCYGKVFFKKITRQCSSGHAEISFENISQNIFLEVQ